MIYSDNEITPSKLTFNDISIPVYTFDSVIVGSGAAGLSAAGALLSMGHKNIAVITESMKAGASKNSASNSQTYYKISLYSEQTDSVRNMAKDFYAGFSMDGDMALTQAALSARCFYRLADLGVGFPQNDYGEFAEYGKRKNNKTEPKRITDAGHFTAKKIAEAAEKNILDGSIPVFNRFRVISVIKSGGENGGENAVGLLAIDRDMQKIYAEKIREYNRKIRINNANKNIFGRIQERLNFGNSKANKTTAAVQADFSKSKNGTGISAYHESVDMQELVKPSGNEYGYVLFRAANIIYAVGGPAGIYEDGAHLYPQNMTCSLGTAFMAGVTGKNLTETIFGTACVPAKAANDSNALKWKIEGDLLRVIPRYYSVDQDGGDEREFLEPYFSGASEMVKAMLKKSENWGFDTAVPEASIIDFAVYSEKNKNRRVFVDYTDNPKMVAVSLLNSSKKNINHKPYERLRKLNRNLYDLLLSNGADLGKEPLEVNICAYHLNGGLDCDIYSESNIKHFFPVGEAAAVFGVYVPDGASLAATQVTSFRAAEKIVRDYKDSTVMEMPDFEAASVEEVNKYITVAKHLLKNAVKNVVSENVFEMREKYQKRFSGCGMIIRSLEDITLAIAECRFDMANFINDNKIDDISYLSDVFETHDILVTQYAFLQTVRNYIMSGGKSRGSYIVSDSVTKSDILDLCSNTRSLTGIPESKTENPASEDFNSLVSFMTIKSSSTFEIDFSTRKVNDMPSKMR